MYLGLISSHDGTLSLVDEGKHIFALGEERLNRTKAYIGFPFRAVRYIVEQGIVDSGKIASVGVGQRLFTKRSAEVFAFTLTEDKKYYDLQNDKRPADFHMADNSWRSIRSDDDCVRYVHRRTQELLAESGITAPITFYEHHHCHAASAYFSSGLDRALIITMDGEGDGLSATVSLGQGPRLDRISETDRLFSAGYLYSAVTRKCGFKMSRHEGKITGLAAYGDFAPYLDQLLGDVFVEHGELRIAGLQEGTIVDRARRKFARVFGMSSPPTGMDEVLGRLGDISNKDLAAVVQEVLERRISEIVEYWVEKTNIRDVVLAGGVFANVKFNQKVGEIPRVNSLFVFPDMGDGGTAYGAAMCEYVRANGYNRETSRLKDVYLGPQFSDDEIDSALSEEADWLEYRRSDDVAHDTAELIARRKIVGWFQGRMEYGPRALGNRSVLASATDASINKWLNDRMKRTEFMPFAPSCLYERADEVFDIPKEALKRPAEFMTITFRMKPEWSAKTPAISHVDGTARPQLVREDVNPLYHRMLLEYERITGLPLVINTSFNVHEEPIVCHPSEGIAALKRGMVDLLAIGPFIARAK